MIRLEIFKLKYVIRLGCENVNTWDIGVYFIYTQIHNSCPATIFLIKSNYITISHICEAYLKLLTFVNLDTFETRE